MSKVFRRSCDIEVSRFLNEEKRSWQQTQEYRSMLLDVIGSMDMPLEIFMPVATIRSQWRLDQGKNDGFVEGIDWLVEEGYLKQGTSTTFCALTEYGSSVIEKKNETKKSAV